MFKPHSTRVIPSGVGLITLFDGMGTAFDLISRMGVQLQAIIAAEWDQFAREFTADRLGYRLDQSWAKNKHGISTCYVKDVWRVLDQNGLILRQLFAQLVPPRRVFLLSGSPCQDLTTYGKHGGAMGIVGSRSVHFHILPVLVHLMRAIDPEVAIFVMAENAGSMKRHMHDYMVTVLGIPYACSKQINAKHWSHVARNRRYLTSSVGWTCPPAQPPPWEPGWSPPYVNGQPKCLPPWLRSRGTTDRGEHVETTAAYDPRHLLYKVDVWGSLEAFWSFTGPFRVFLNNRILLSPRLSPADTPPRGSLGSTSPVHSFPSFR